ELRELLAWPASEKDILARVEQLASDRMRFIALVHIWGPALYARSRVQFRPFIIAQLTAWGGWGFQTAWKGGTGKVLNDWLHAVDQANDIELFRALYLWKTVGHDLKNWYKDLLTAFRAADGPGERARALEKYDQSWQLDHATATALYETDPDVTRDFI